MRKEQEINEAIERYADTVRRLCMLHLKTMPTLRIFSKPYSLKYALNTEPLRMQSIKKAWLIRVTINACKDLLKSFFRSRTVSLDEVLEQPVALSPDHREKFLEAVLSLPQKYRDVIYLHYYEGYSAPEISRIPGKTSTRFTRCWGRAEQQLREALGGDGDA